MAAPPMVVMQQGAAPPAAPLSGDPMVDGLVYFPALLVKQKPRGWFFEMCCGVEIENKYKIYNPMGANPKDEMLVAREESAFCCRQCCGPYRSFEMSITTNDGKEITRFDRPYRCGRKGGCCCCGCDSCFQSINVFAGQHCAAPNAPMGRIREEFSCCVPVITVRDEADRELYRLVGECCGCWNYAINIYPASNPDAQPIGRITKQWSGAFKELFTDADNFFVEFPATASGRDRMLLLGATFFIDFLYFEKQKDNNQASPSHNNNKARSLAEFVQPFTDPREPYPEEAESRAMRSSR